jgi:hypothetical protein
MSKNNLWCHAFNTNDTLSPRSVLTEIFYAASNASHHLSSWHVGITHCSNRADHEDILKVKYVSKVFRSQTSMGSGLQLVVTLISHTHYK